MNILWFTNTPCSYSQVSGYNGGGWLVAAEQAIRNVEDINLSIGFLLDGQPKKDIQDGITYYPIPTFKNILIRKIFNVLGVKQSLNRTEKSLKEYYVNYFRKIIEDSKPDVIHVWGSENVFGYVSEFTDIPVILHIQGLMNPCYNAFLPPFVSMQDYCQIKSFNPIKVLRQKSTITYWRQACKREFEVFQHLHFALGRTKWDQRVCHIMNPSLNYRTVNEILRPIFYEKCERHLPERLTIVTTISQPLYKGFDLILKTASLLSNNLNLDFEWKCYGNIDPKMIEKQIGIKHTDVNVKLMGVATAEELQKAELTATLYFHSSYIDNSPNSLCEAQMLGLPIVSTNVGGIPTLVDDGVDGFLIPSNDPYQGAYTIELLWKNKLMNMEFGKKAQQKALQRHNPQTIITQILNVYKEIEKNTIAFKKCLI